jgi:hypothetical protein
VYAGEDSAKRIEQILDIISGGTFPRHGNLEITPGQRRQLRDAMIFEAHVRDRRDVFITNDARGFIREGRREALEQLYNTRVMRVDEACAFLKTVRESATQLRAAHRVRRPPFVDPNSSPSAGKKVLACVLRPLVSTAA